MKKPTLYIIIPCYNEEKVLPITCEMFLDKITELIQNDKIDDSSKIIIVPTVFQSMLQRGVQSDMMPSWKTVCNP